MSKGLRVVPLYFATSADGVSAIVDTKPRGVSFTRKFVTYIGEGFETVNASLLEHGDEADMSDAANAYTAGFFQTPTAWDTIGAAANPNYPRWGEYTGTKRYLRSTINYTSGTAAMYVGLVILVDPLVQPTQIASETTLGLSQSQVIDWFYDLILPTP
jgi:hypothetical protein